MKKGKKGFVVSAVLYPLLVLFLAIIMGLLSMTDTRKRILDKMKLEITDNIFDDAACSCDTILAKLNYIIANGTGGSGGDTGSYAYNKLTLNVKTYESYGDFPVVGNIIGDIAVLSDTPIKNYYVSKNVPKSPQEGTVWIVQDNTSNYYVTSDWNRIGISYVMQYENSKWVLKKSYVYNGESWTMLYYVKLSNSYVDLTATDINADIETNFDYTGEFQMYTARFSGYYKIELWGAQGGVIWSGGKGAYTSGEIYLDAGQVLYIYVGGKGSGQTGGWNGGGNGGTNSGDDRRYGRGGGGATDVRLVSTSDKALWNETSSLLSRIMVAAGGGGDAHRYYTPDSGNYYSNGYGGAGGGLKGYDGSVAASKNWGTSGQQGMGANQATPGYTLSLLSSTGDFGYGGTTPETGAGGGGGWYGGGASNIGGVGAAGGSSYISGHAGSDSVSIAETNKQNGNIVHRGSSHYDENYWFRNTDMIDGNGYRWGEERYSSVVGMPTIDGSTTMTGNTGNGHAKITLMTVQVIEENELNKLRQDSEKVWSYSYSGNSQTLGKYQLFEAPVSGTYSIEAWGAQGGVIWNGGKGAYTYGDIDLKKGEKLYVYVGGTGNGSIGGWNGGGSNTNSATADDRRYGRGGGGATDIRYQSTSSIDSWYGIDSIKSRIMVAAGGGGDAQRYYNPDSGNYYSNGYGGAGGGITGYDGSVAASKNGWSTYDNRGTGAGQGIAGYIYNNIKNTGAFAQGATSPDTGAGGGGGWYGGGASQIGGVGAGGGSSYISGHNGSNSISEESTTADILHTGSRYHYSNFYFSNTKMIDGNGYEWSTVRGALVSMPTKGKTSTMTGNTGNGYARIALKEINETSRDKQEESEWHYEYAGKTANTGSYQEFTASVSGVYRFELWGAQGGVIWSGGKGSYTSGEMYMNAGEKLYIYVGSKGINTYGGWNGGGDGAISTGDDRRNGRGGGGATDIRISKTSNLSITNEYDSLTSRIMVAAGGGGDAQRYYNPDSGTYYSNGYGGAGGGLKGYDGYTNGNKNWNSNNSQGIGGTQTLPGYEYSSLTKTASFGVGQTTTGNGGGGGGGWYGGGASEISGIGGAGGSSYILGHSGCSSISSDSSYANLIHTGSSYNDNKENYYFTNTQMIDGNGYSWGDYKKNATSQPTIDGSSTQTGKSGDGYAKITLKEKKNSSREKKNETSWLYTYAGTTSLSGQYQEFNVEMSGTYKIQLWGAQGGSIWSGGKGGYTEGNIYLTKGTQLYIYVGGTTNNTTGGYNGGGNGAVSTGDDRRTGRGGGGSTDIRLVSGSWVDAKGINSRIMVAAGGGGDAHRYYSPDSGNYYSNGYGGSAGGLKGYDGYTNGNKNWHSNGQQGIGGTQSKPGYTLSVTSNIASLGIGGTTTGNGAGGGGGYYGGGASNMGGIGGAGGSSYISGHEGCIAIDASGSPLVDSYTTLADSVHLSGYKFTNTYMVDGNGYFWDTEKRTLVNQYDNTGTTTQAGQSGNGYAKITYLGA